MNTNTTARTASELRANLSHLVDLHATTNTPAETIAALIAGIGNTAARETVANLVNLVGEWDGRVSNDSRKWAAGVNGSTAKNDLEAFHIYQPGAIHPCHIEQIAREMMKQTSPAK